MVFSNFVMPYYHCDVKGFQMSVSFTYLDFLFRSGWLKKSTLTFIVFAILCNTSRVVYVLQDEVPDNKMQNVWWNHEFTFSASQFVSTVDASPFELNFGCGTVNPSRKLWNCFVKSRMYCISGPQYNSDNRSTSFLLSRRNLLTNWYSSRSIWICNSGRAAFSPCTASLAGSHPLLITYAVNKSYCFVDLIASMISGIRGNVLSVTCRGLFNFLHRERALQDIWRSM